MVRLEELTPGVRVSGILPGAVRIIAVHTYGNGAVEITYKDADGEVGQQILYRADESKLGLATVSGPTFDGDGAAFRLAAEALRIRMAGQHDTMLAVTTSDLDPLPHQIKAVYGELLPGCRCGSCSPTTLGRQDHHGWALCQGAGPAG
jgi:hypothetical protein